MDLTSLPQRLVAAWNGGDAAAFAALFTPSAEYVTGAGEWIRSAAEVARLATRAGGVHVAIDGAPSIRVHGDSATVVFRWRAAGGDAARQGIIACAAVRDGDSWRVDHLQNTNVERGAGIRALVAMAHVKSVARSIEFYRTLGFAVGNTVVPDGGTEPSWAWLNSARADLMVSRADEPVDSEEHTVLFYLYCDDVASYRETLLGKGLKPSEITYPFYSPRGEFCLSDPDGYVLFVAHT